MHKVYSVILFASMLILCGSCKSTKIWENESIKQSPGFKISLPENWSYQRTKGWDSFVGEIHGPNLVLNFELSPDGYASSLNQSPSDSLLGVPWEQIEIIDTIDGFHRKIVLPDNNENGLTGIYLQNIESGLDFNLYGYDLDFENQKLAAKAFKSIRIIRNKKIFR